MGPARAPIAVSKDLSNRGAQARGHDLGEHGRVVGAAPRDERARREKDGGGDADGVALLRGQGRGGSSTGMRSAGSRDVGKSFTDGEPPRNQERSGKRDRDRELARHDAPGDGSALGGKVADDAAEGRADGTAQAPERDDLGNGRDRVGF